MAAMLDGQNNETLLITNMILLPNYRLTDENHELKILKNSYPKYKPGRHIHLFSYVNL